MTKKNEFGKAHEYRTIKLSEIYNDIKQVRKKTAQKDLDKIEDSIKAMGQQTPIGVCFSEVTEESDQYNYHLIYGQKRMLAMANLGKTEIEAKVYIEPKKWTTEQILIEALAENYADTQMDKTEVWNIIKEFYFHYDKNLKKVQAVTGIRYEDLKEAVKSHEIEEIKGGPEVLAHVINAGEFTEKNVMEIINVCLIDNKTVDLEKAIKFHDEFAKVPINSRKNVLKVAKASHGKEIETWIADGKALKVLKSKAIPFEEHDLQRIQNYAKTLGMTFSDYVVAATLDSITVDVAVDSDLED
jgi:ParB/RepB/Spo0J family partition protein